MDFGSETDFRDFPTAMRIVGRLLSYGWIVGLFSAAYVRFREAGCCPPKPSQDPPFSLLPHGFCLANFLLVWSKDRMFVLATRRLLMAKRNHGNAGNVTQRFKPPGEDSAQTVEMVPRNFSTLPPSVRAFLFSLKIREKKTPQKKLISNPSRYGRHTVYFFVEGFRQI